MKWPELIPKSMCQTDIHIRIDSEEIGEEGQPITLIDADFKCNYQDKAKRVMTNEQKIVQVTGSAHFLWRYRSRCTSDQLRCRNSLWS